MNTLLNTDHESILLPGQTNHLLLAVTEGKEREGLTELIARSALKGPFYFIAGGGWVPDQDDLRISIGRHTTDIDRVLDNPSLTRPTTCLQLLDLIASVGAKTEPLLILDFLNLFYNTDIVVSSRIRIIEQCCEHLQRIKLLRPVVIFIQQAFHDEYDLFFSVIASIANETVELGRDSLLRTLLPEAYMGKDLKSSRALAEKLVAKLTRIGRVIPNDRSIIKKFGALILKNSVAIANATDLSPMEAALTMIALEEHKRMDKLTTDIEIWMQELEKRIDEFIPVNE